MRKTFGVGMAAAMLLALMALPAAAQDAYPPAAPSCNVAISSINVSCAGWAPSTPVTATLGGEVLGTLVTDAQGRLTGSFEIPADLAPGTHTLRLSGLNAAGVLTHVDFVITIPEPAAVVTPPGIVPAPHLPRTGGDALLALGLAAGLLATGGGALGVARRRNQAELSA